MSNIERFLSYISSNFVQLSDLEVYTYGKRFDLDKETSIRAIKHSGWQLEERNKDVVIWWSPSVKDRNKMTGY